MTNDYCARLFAHLAWADARALESLQAADQVVVDAVRFFAHILAAECIWLARIEGRHATRPVWPTLGVAECEELARENQAEWLRYMATLTPAELERGVTYTNSAGAVFTTRVDDILLHVALHGAYHRGQVARSVREAGYQPKATDYIAFVRGAEAPKAR